MEQYTQAVNVAAWGGLSFAILLWRGVSRRAEWHSIFDLPWLEMARNAKIDEIDLFSRSTHNIGGFEIAENDRRLAMVQVIEDGAEFKANGKRFFERKAMIGLAKHVVFERFALNEVHNEIPVSTLAEVVIDMRQVGMHKIGKHTRLALEVFNGLASFLRAKTALAHFFDGDLTTKLHILCLIDSSKSTPANLRENAVAAIEKLSGGQQAGHASRRSGYSRIKGRATGHTENGLRLVSGTAGFTGTSRHSYVSLFFISHF